MSQGFTRVFNDEQQVPYAYNASYWIGYEDVQSAKIKVLKIIY